MFAFNFLGPACRRCARTFTTKSASRLRTPLRSRPVHSAPFASAFHRPRIAWRTAFSQAQQRASYRRQAFDYQTFQRSQSLLKRWAARPTFYYEVGGITVICVAFYTSNLEQVPVSGRYRFNIVKSTWEASVGKQMYESTLSEFRSKLLPETSREHRMVERVLNRLIPNSGLADEQWEVHVINDPMKNAFVIPGGKVFVFKGILDICQGEDGLAAVLGHEIAHNVAHHAAERMSQSFFLIPVLLVAYLSGLDFGIGRDVVNLAFTLPGSRKQEAEADYIGLLMMAQSCFDPKAAVGLWSRMEKEEQGRTPPQFLNTHPSSHNRMEKIKEWLPRAESAQESSDCGVMTGYVDDFRSAVEYPREWS